jgi:hypothetical protein
VLRPLDSHHVALNDMSAMESKYDHEYLIKFKSMSYLHVQWLNAAEVGTYSYLLIFYLINVAIDDIRSNLTHSFHVLKYRRRGDERQVQAGPASLPEQAGPRRRWRSRRRRDRPLVSTFSTSPDLHY